MARRRVAIFLMLPALLMNLASADSLLEGKQLTAALAAGGYVILMSHASASGKPPTRSTVVPGNISGEIQLDERGAQSARALGEALRRLQIHVGKVLSSPAFRALETAQLAQLPDAHAYDDLAEAGRTAERAASLRAEVALTPAAGTNTVIITHQSNITDAFASDAKDLADGEALIYRPDGHGKAALVARVKIEEWPKLAATR